jgi:hypothetical protein
VPVPAGRGDARWQGAAAGGEPSGAGLSARPALGRRKRGVPTPDHQIAAGEASAASVRPPRQASVFVARQLAVRLSGSGLIHWIWLATRVESVFCERTPFGAPGDAA